MEFIASNELPPPAGHYSQAVAAGSLVFLHYGFLVEVQLVAQRPG